VEDTEAHDQEAGPQAARVRRSAAATITLLVVIAVLAFTVIALSRTPDAAPEGSDATDAVTAYDAALAAGRPIYVLFHSRTCQSCIEIDAVAREVVPEYAGRVSFVDAITDDPSGMELASRLTFQFIPTSFFLRSDGTIVDMYTGVLDADAMRARLDDLLQDE